MTQDNTPITTPLAVYKHSPFGFYSLTFAGFTAVVLVVEFFSFYLPHQYLYSKIGNFDVQFIYPIMACILIPIDITAITLSIIGFKKDLRKEFSVIGLATNLGLFFYVLGFTFLIIMALSGTG